MREKMELRCCAVHTLSNLSLIILKLDAESDDDDDDDDDEEEEDDDDDNDDGDDDVEDWNANDDENDDDDDGKREERSVVRLSAVSEMEEEPSMPTTLIFPSAIIATICIQVVSAVVEQHQGPCDPHSREKIERRQRKRDRERETWET